jgi:hypothetical protein
MLSFCIFWFSFANASPATSGSTFKIVTIEHLELNYTAQKAFDYLKGALENAGIENIERVDAPSGRTLSLVNQGKFDALFADSSYRLSSYENLIKPRFPYFKVRLDIISLKSNLRFNPKNLEKFHGATLLNRPEIMDLKLKKNYDFYQIPSIEQAIKMLVEKRVDYIIMPWSMLGGYFAADPSLESRLSLAQNILPDVEYYVVLHKRHQKLLPAIEKSLIAASRDLSKFPELESIVIKY